jgi:uncharacterized protein (UPF0332 family)
MTADCLSKISDNAELKKNLSFPAQFESYVWIINASYYSMFYTATALLAFHGHKIKSEQGIHALTYNALIYYFLDNDKKLEKHILEKYRQVEKEAAELLQLAQEEARGQIERVKYEMEKRRIFTYYMGVSAEKSKAHTSFQRAKEFITLAKEMMIQQL